jgi:hypothetical protein
MCVLAFLSSALLLPALAEADTVLGQSQAQQLVLKEPLPCYLQVIKRAKARFLLGAKGELIQQGGHDPTGENTVSLLADGTEANLIKLMEKECIQVAKVSTKQKLEWFEPYASLPNLPKSLKGERFVSDYPATKTLVIANSMRLRKGSLEPEKHCKLFRLHSGDFLVLPDESPNYEFLCYLELSNDEIIATMPGMERERKPLFRVYSSGVIEVQDAELASQHLPQSRWKILDATGKCALPPEGIDISRDLSTPEMVLQDDGSYSLLVTVID